MHERARARDVLPAPLERGAEQQRVRAVHRAAASAAGQHGRARVGRVGGLEVTGRLQQRAGHGAGERGRRRFAEAELLDQPLELLRQRLCGGDVPGGDLGGGEHAQRRQLHLDPPGPGERPPRALEQLDGPVAVAAKEPRDASEQTRQRSARGRGVVAQRALSHLLRPPEVPLQVGERGA